MWVTSRLNFRLKCYVSRWSLWTVRWGNDSTATFLSKKLCSRLRSIEVEFYSKKESSLSEPPFGRLRGIWGNVRTSSIARWKARVRLPIRHNLLTFFASFYCWDVTGGRNLSTWAIFEEGWVTSIAHFRWKSRRPPTTVGWQKTRRIGLSYGVKISPVGSLD